MQERVGFPHFILNDTELDDYYDGVSWLLRGRNYDSIEAINVGFISLF